MQKKKSQNGQKNTKKMGNLQKKKSEKKVQNMGENPKWAGKNISKSWERIHKNE